MDVKVINVKKKCERIDNVNDMILNIEKNEIRKSKYKNHIIII
jgi:hypothetical protein